MSLFKMSGWLLPVVLLIGCDNGSHTVATQGKQGVALPALPIIQGAVMSLVPMPDGQRNELMMSQVCALARGESTQQQVAQNLLQQGIDLSRVPQQGHPLSLLVDPDLSRRITACAAYIATSVMMLPKTSEFMVEANTAPVSGKKKLNVDSQKLNYFLGIQLAIAKADAYFFALIATRLEKTSGLTLEQYTQQAKIQFVAIAPLYLQRVKDLYAQGQNVQYSLVEYSDSNFKFTSNNGYLFEFGYDGLNLSFNRMPWYGAGKLLGKSYLLEVDCFAKHAIEKKHRRNA
ncbi:hypothetical protein ACI77J_17450 [Pseudomonas sp. O64]|uniref:hypothetical protein n=1 Tax=Pseudomonas TaxID=286 RepID=UPI000BA13FC8|nr:MULTISPECIES: hypothetical protein [unclassified Pseudomonas]MCV2231098.1 hypothetical protein [Pseudomonas sp. AU10]OZO03849.1 hypothetical protein B7453_14280 [Pseudomonas sp. IB20]UXZ23084.1 hypothetical protein KZH41_02325 [Pseudomonas sp. YeP6b]